MAPISRPFADRLPNSSSSSYTCKHFHVGRHGIDANEQSKRVGRRERTINSRVGKHRVEGAESRKRVRLGLRKTRGDRSRVANQPWSIRFTVVPHGTAQFVPARSFATFLLNLRRVSTNARERLFLKRNEAFSIARSTRFRNILTCSKGKVSLNIATSTVPLAWIRDAQFPVVSRLLNPFNLDRCTA